MSSAESKSKIKVAAWVDYEDLPWAVKDVAEWTYKRPEGDLTVFASNPKKALEVMAAHGFRNLDAKFLVQTGGRLADHLKRTEIK